jgi:hypothetical protein
LLRDMSDRNRLILAGIVTGLVYQFHNVAFFCCYVAFAVTLLFNLKHFKFSYLYFLIPTAIALPFILGGGASFQFIWSNQFANDFAPNPLTFYLLNLGIPLVLAILSFFKRGDIPLKITAVVLFIIPNVLLLTPWDWDMYKFFIFAWVPIAVLAAMVLAKLPRPVVVALVLFSILTSASVIVANVESSNLGASWSEYNLGIWVRNNTPQNAVFLTAAEIHAPPTMIGGRLRVSSYFYWPYGHGVPMGDIFERDHNIDLAYNGTAQELASVVREYNVSYVYVGNDELNDYPLCIAHFDGVNWLMQVYADGNLRVYQVNTDELPAT